MNTATTRAVARLAEKISVELRALDGAFIKQPGNFLFAKGVQGVPESSRPLPSGNSLAYLVIAAGAAAARDSAADAPADNTLLPFLTSFLTDAIGEAIVMERRLMERHRR